MISEFTRNSRRTSFGLTRLHIALPLLHPHGSQRQEDGVEDVVVDVGAHEAKGFACRARRGLVDHGEEDDGGEKTQDATERKEHFVEAHLVQAEKAGIPMPIAKELCDKTG